MNIPNLIPAPNLQKLPDEVPFQDRQTGTSGDSFSNLLQTGTERSEQGRNKPTAPFASDTAVLSETLELDLAGETLRFVNMGVLLNRRLGQGAQYPGTGQGDEYNSPIPISPSEPVDKVTAILSPGGDTIIPLPADVTLFVDKTHLETPIERRFPKVDAHQAFVLGRESSQDGPFLTFQSQANGPANQSPLTGTKTVAGIVPNPRVTAPSNASVSQPQSGQISSPAEQVRSESLSKIEAILQSEGADLDLSVSRGELGLIIVVTMDKMEARRLKQLEERLTRLVESEGEKLERLDIRDIGIPFAAQISRQREGA